MRTILGATLLLLFSASSSANTIDSLAFLPGTSTLGSYDGIVVATYTLGTTPNNKGLICDNNNRAIDATAICYALGYAQKGAILVWKGDLSKVNNVPTNRIDSYRCTRLATDAGYLGSCSFLSSATCAQHQILAVACQDPRGVTTTVPPPIPTLAPVDCTKGASANIRLIDQSNNNVTTTGRLEIYDTNTKIWNPVCNYDFYNKQAAFVCNMLCSGGTDPKALSGPKTGVSPTVVLNCPTSATNFNGCSMEKVSGKPTSVKDQCQEKDLAYVQCTPPTVAPPASSEPVADVRCVDNIATVSFNKTANPGISNTSLMLINSGTQKPECSFNTTDTGTHVVVTFTFALCGGTVEFNANETTFKNTFLRMFEPVNGVLTQANISFGVHCTLKKTVDVESQDLQGKTQTAKPIGGTDSPTVVLKIYMDSKMTQEMTPGQEFDLQPSTRFYVRIQETSNIAETQMAVRSCWLTPTKDRNSATQQKLIVDGCAHSTYVKQLGYVDAMTQTYQFQPVLFPGYKSFYLHCNTRTCSKSDTSTACSRSCTNNNPSFARRRKRSVDISELLKALAARGISPGEQTVDKGPFYASGRFVTGAGTLRITAPLLLFSCLLALAL